MRCPFFSWKSYWTAFCTSGVLKTFVSPLRLPSRLWEIPHQQKRYHICSSSLRSLEILLCGSRWETWQRGGSRCAECCSHHPSHRLLCLISYNSIGKATRVWGQHEHVTAQNTRLIPITLLGEREIVFLQITSRCHAGVSRAQGLIPVGRLDAGRLFERALDLSCMDQGCAS